MVLVWGCDWVACGVLGTLWGVVGAVAYYSG